MKDFLKYMLATILGLIATTTLFVILGIISLAGMVASSSSAPEIQKESVFVLELKGNIIERCQSTGPVPGRRTSHIRTGRPAGCHQESPGQ